MYVYFNFLNSNKLSYFIH